MNVRTDLAVESIRIFGQMPHGSSRENFILKGMPCTRIRIWKEDASRALGRPCGEYDTLDCGAFGELYEDRIACAEAVGLLLKELLPPEGRILAAGLGNRQITPDSLGPETARRLLATGKLGQTGLRTTAVIEPGVAGQTGMESGEILEALISRFKPAAVIAADALAASETMHLGKTIQICNSGICPGSGVANSRKELSQKTLGVPVIAIGVPTVMDFRDEKSGAFLMVTPREIDSMIRKAAEILALGINLALYPQLTAEELISLTE